MFGNPGDKAKGMRWGFHMVIRGDDQQREGDTVSVIYWAHVESWNIKKGGKLVVWKSAGQGRLCCELSRTRLVQ